MTGLLHGAVRVVTTDFGGHSPEYYADRIMERILYISNSIPEPLRLQAHEFKDSIHQVVLTYLKAAVVSERTTVEAKLQQAGFSEAAKLIRE